MPRGVRLAVVAALASVATCVWPRSASAAVTGPCTASLAGVPVDVGRDSPSEAIRVQHDAAVTMEGSTTGGQGVSGLDIEIEVLGVRLTLGEELPASGTTFAGVVSVRDYSGAGVGLYRVIGTASDQSGGALCQAVAVVCVTGRPALATAAGGTAATLGAVGVGLVVLSVLRRRGSTAGVVAQMGTSGLLIGTAVPVLLQQSCGLELTGGGLAGMALGASLLLGGLGGVLGARRMRGRRLRAEVRAPGGSGLRGTTSTSGPAVPRGAGTGGPSVPTGAPTGGPGVPTGAGTGGPSVPTGAPSGGPAAPGTGPSGGPAVPAGAGTATAGGGPALPPPTGVPVAGAAAAAAAAAAITGGTFGVGGGRRDEMPVYRRTLTRDCPDCREHADHRAYRTWEVAKGDALHDDCTCIVVIQHVPADAFEEYFAGGADLYDDRGHDDRGHDQPGRGDRRP